MTEAHTMARAAPASRIPGTFDWIIACGAFAVLVTGLMFTPEAPPGLSVCVFHSMTGLPCPGCGLTRSFCAIAHLRWGDAWNFNPFGFIWYGLTLLLAARPVLIRRTDYAEYERRWMNSHWSYILPIALVTLMWAFGLCRMWNVAQQRSTPTVIEAAAEEPSPLRHD